MAESGYDQGYTYDTAKVFTKGAKMSDEESRREDFVRGDHDEPHTVTVTATIRFTVDQTSPKGETIFAEENVTAQLERIMERNYDIVDFEIEYSEEN